jgi:orotate phosphoribosyltransferase
MSSVNEAGLKVAEFLLRIKAVKLQPTNPFTWASGWNSPIYCDNRLTLSYPDVRTFIRQEFVRVIEEKYASVDVICGVATGGIGIGALVAQEMGLPFCYVRSSSKGHGLQNQIEGKLDNGQSVVVIEDLISTGGSSLKAVAALREAGAEVKGMVGIFTYGFGISKTAFEEAGVDLVTLTDYHTLIRQALDQGYVKEEEVASLREWRENPQSWGK